MTTLWHWIFIPTQEQTWLQVSLCKLGKSSWLEWKGLAFNGRYSLYGNQEMCDTLQFILFISAVEVLSSSQREMLPTFFRLLRGTCYFLPLGFFLNMKKMEHLKVKGHIPEAWNLEHQQIWIFQGAVILLQIRIKAAGNIGVCWKTKTLD